MAFNYSPKIVTDGLVFAVDAANKKSYPGSGTTWSDLSGNGNNGTLTNGPTYNSNNGGYFSFDGTDDHVATTYDATGKINMTFCMWLSVDNFNVTNGGTLFDQSTGSTGFGIRTFSSDTIQVFARNSNASSVNLISPYTGLSTGTWYYVCVKFETNSITTYLDGAVNSTNSATLDTISVDSSNNMEIGGRNDTTDGHLDGNIAFVQIYEKALTSDEVSQNYNALKSRFGL